MASGPQEAARGQERSTRRARALRARREKGEKDEQEDSAEDGERFLVADPPKRGEVVPHARPRRKAS